MRFAFFGVLLLVLCCLVALSAYWQTKTHHSFYDTPGWHCGKLGCQRVPENSN